MFMLWGPRKLFMESRFYVTTSLTHGERSHRDEEASGSRNENPVYDGFFKYLVSDTPLSPLTVQYR